MEKEETSGVLVPEALQLLQDLGHYLGEATGEQRSYQFLLQRVSVAVAVREHGGCCGMSQGILGLGVGGALAKYDHYCF